MKKMGIATLYFYNNFGSVLQAYALKNVLEGMNVDVEFLPYKPAIPNVKYFQDTKLQKKYFEKGQKFDAFRNKILNIKDGDIRESNLLNKELDGYIVGSDIVWGREFSNLDPVYFLDFVDKGKVRATYAASMIFNSNGLPENDAIYEKYIPKFDYLSVREQSSVPYIQKLTEKKVYTVLDPTLLLNSSQYDSIADCTCGREQKSPYLLSYFLTHDPAVVDYTNMIAKKLGLRVVHFFADYPKRVFDENAGDFTFVGPSEFLGLVKNAACIFTNSFHGTCFSIIYRKPFYTYTAKRSLLSRVDNMAERLDIKARCFTDFRDLNKVTLDIDYTEVERRIEVEKKYSLEYLRSVVEGLYV